MSTSHGRVSRRALLRGAGAVAGAGALLPLAGHGVADAATPVVGGARNAISDPLYRNGTYLMPTTPSTIPLKTLDFGTPTSAKPQWQVAEWHAKNSIAEAGLKTFSPGSVPGLSFPGVGYESSDHRIIRGYNGEFWMSYDARSFFSDGPRTAGQGWPELHLQQYWSLPEVDTDPLKLADLAHLNLIFHVRIPYIINYMSPSDYDPDLHTAQSTIYMTVQNLNTASDDYGKYIWFGVPIADYRYDIPPGYTAGDNGHPGSTGQIIETQAGTDFWASSVKDGLWHRTRRDLVPLMRKAFTSAQGFGYLPATTVDDMYVASFDVEWELPGTFGFAMEFQTISLQAVTK